MRATFPREIYSPPRDAILTNHMHDFEMRYNKY